MRRRRPVPSFVRHALVLARAEVLHIVRDRATLAQLILMPLIQLLVLSSVATFEIRQSPLYLVDFDHSSSSRGLVSRLAASGLFAVVGQSASPAAANEAMLRGRVALVLTIPRDFESALTRDHEATVHLDVNAEKGLAAGIVQSYATQIIDAYAREVGVRLAPTVNRAPGTPAIERALARGPGSIEMAHRMWFNPTLDYKHYMVPGILVALVTMIGTLVTAQNIAREKEMGTLEQLNVTPITKGEFITAKLLPFWVLGMIDLALGLIVATAVFGVPARGSLLLLFGAAGVYLLVALGIGLWISAMVETQQQAMFVTFFVLMIYLLISGLLTPLDSMPRWVRLASELNPVRHFVTITRAILIKGAGPTEIARPLGALALYAVVVLTFAVRRYRKAVV